MNDWTLGDDGLLHGPDGATLRPISGGQDLGDLGLWDPGSMGLGSLGDLGNLNVPDVMQLPGAADAIQAGTGGADSLGGVGSMLSGLSGLAKDALPFLQLGTQGLGMYSGIRGMQTAGQQANLLKSAQHTQQQAAAPLLAAGQSLTPAGTQAVMGGPLPPQLESVVNAWTQGHIAQMRQQFASMGIQDSGMIQEAEAAITQSAQLLRAQLAQGLLQSGEQAALGAAQAVTPLEGSAANQQTQIASAIQAANAALSQMLGRT